MERLGALCSDPNMLKHSEAFFEGYQSTKLYYQLWEPPQSRGTIIITHGHGEHSGSYRRLIQSFEKESWTIYAWDLRGHGRSEGKRGYAKEFDDYCYDFVAFLDLVLARSEVRAKPIVLFCHSMGALIELKALLKNPKIYCHGMIVSSPLLGLSLKVPRFIDFVAKILNAILPRLTLSSILDGSKLSRDPQVLKEYQQDPLRHTSMSAGVYLGILESCQYVRKHAQQLHIDTLFLVSDRDQVISSSEAMEVFKKIGSHRKEIKVYHNAKHELVNDTIREKVFSDLKEYLDEIAMQGSIHQPQNPVL
jgi:alpha-beta hydrolase superfamily lysophospholipase